MGEERKKREAEEELRRKEAELSPEEKEAKQLKEAGNELYKNKEFDKAIEKYQAALDLVPNEITYALNIASALLGKQDLDGCIKQCEKALEISKGVASYENIAKAYERMGNAYFKFKKYKEALEQYNTAQINLKNRKVADKIRKIEKKLKDIEAKEYINPEKALEAKEQGNVEFKKGDYPEALKNYTEAIKRDPTNAIYYNNRSACFTKLADFGRAKEDCNMALKLDPNYVKAYARKGKIETFIKDYKGALESFSAGLKIDPENQECLLGMQQVQEAIRSGNSEDDEIRRQRAMNDPEIQNIMSDPVMMNVLRDLQENPKSAMKYLSNPEIKDKLDKLIASGIIKTA